MARGRAPNYASQREAILAQAAVLFARSEGLVPAPESSHAIAAVVNEAVKCRESGQKKVLLFNLSGHGLLDLSSYESYLHGKLQDV